MSFCLWKEAIMSQVLSLDANYKYTTKSSKLKSSNLVKHINRTEKDPKENINPERTHLNKNLIKDDDGKLKFVSGERAGEFIHQRTEQAKRQFTEITNRKVAKDTIVTRNIVFSMSGIDKDDTEATTKMLVDGYAWAVSEFGEENVIGCSLHRDEEQPHVHITVMPRKEKEFFIGRQSKKQKEAGIDNRKKVTALGFCNDEVFSQNFFQTVNERARTFMRSKGYDVEMENVGDGHKHMHIDKFKAVTKAEEAQNERLDARLREIKENTDKAIREAENEASERIRSYKRKVNFDVNDETFNIDRELRFEKYMLNEKGIDIQPHLIDFDYWEVQERKKEQKRIEEKEKVIKEVSVATSNVKSKYSPTSGLEY